MSYTYRMTSHCALADACARDEGDAAQSSRDRRLAEHRLSLHETVVA